MSPNRLTILFGDTDATSFAQAASLLEPQGVAAVQVRTGREALSRIESGQVHVAVLDQQMPQMSGLQVIKRVRDLPSPPPVILMTRDASSQLLHEALGMNVFSVLSKPVDLNLLLETLARAMKRHYADRWPVAC